MLTSKEKGALRDPRQMVQLRGEQRQLNEWCRMPGLTITPFMEQKRQQFELKDKESELKREAYESRKRLKSRELEQIAVSKQLKIESVKLIEMAR